jgi:hypothetical protein
MRNLRYEFRLTRLRIPGAALLAVGLLLAHLPAGVGLPCPMRSLTGLPCPFCGSTTSVRDTFGGHVGSAFAVAPLGLLSIAVAVLAVLGLLPKKLALHPAILGTLLLGEWLFELHRFHIWT